MFVAIKIQDMKGDQFRRGSENRWCLDGWED